MKRIQHGMSIWGIMCLICVIWMIMPMQIKAKEYRFEPVYRIEHAIEDDNEVVPMDATYYAMDNVPFYQVPDLWALPSGTLPIDSPVEITGYLGYDWYQIRVEKELYYVQRNYLAESMDEYWYWTGNQYHGAVITLPSGLSDDMIYAFVDRAVERHIGQIDCSQDMGRILMIEEYAYNRMYSNPIEYHYHLLYDVAADYENARVSFTYGTTVLEEEYVTDFVEAFKPEIEKMKSDFDKVQAVYKLICSYVDFDYDTHEYGGLNYHAAQAVLNRMTVGNGYAELFQRFMEELKISSYISMGFVSGEYQVWNTVYVDGEWCQINCAWSDTQLTVL